MVRRNGVCWMCSRAGRLTQEHAFPDWVRRIFAQDGHGIVLSDHRAGIAKRSRTWTNTSGEITVRSVCGDCNNGWMSALEGRCKPLLAPLITGHRAHLGLDAQTDMALWAVKTAWVFQSTNPATSTCTADQRRTLARFQAVPDGVSVLLGGYQEAGDTVLCTSWYAAGATAAAQPDRLDASATTLLIGRVVLQVLQRPAAVTDSRTSAPTQQPARTNAVLRSLLPPTGQPIDWPPGQPLREADLDGFVKPAGFTGRPWASLPALEALSAPEPPAFGPEPSADFGHG
ncbi:MAG TPA: hypothetical protein VNA20_02935 [Frankiaceae bacterium]|nr:hypothetical protein [Frankiaceae bacterium]